LSNLATAIKSILSFGRFLVNHTQWVPDARVHWVVKVGDFCLTMIALFMTKTSQILENKFNVFGRLIRVVQVDQIAILALYFSLLILKVPGNLMQTLFILFWNQFVDSILA
jgi:hypothetical protein